MDLADQMQCKNGHHRFILTCIEIVSRFAWTRPLKTKHGREVAAAIKDIFESRQRMPKRLQTDLGKEFYVHVDCLLEEHCVELFSVMSPQKCALVER